MRRIVILVFLLLALNAFAVVAETRYACSFSTGVTVQSIDGAISSSWGSYERGSDPQPLIFRFEIMTLAEARRLRASASRSDDVKALNMRLLVEYAVPSGYAGWAAGGTGVQDPVRVIRTASGTLTFIETALANVTVTTIFDLKTLDGKLLAVHSRHSSFNGAVVSQYSGACIVEK